jgi:hypothetical protein
MQVYKLTFPDNTIYVGATTKTALQRLKTHYESRNSTNGKSKLIQQAFIKHGLNVKIQVLAECDNKEILLLAEMEAIEKHRSFHEVNQLGLNLFRGGVGMRVGVSHSDYKKEWSKSNKERLEKKRADYYEENKDRLKQAAKDYHEQNKERCLARNREYAKLHSAENSARAGQYQRDNREKTNEKNRLWKASRTPEQKEEINRKRRETRKAKKMLNTQPELAG